MLSGLPMRESQCVDEFRIARRGGHMSVIMVCVSSYYTCVSDVHILIYEIGIKFLSSVHFTMPA
jgi:hypothetical protein